MQEENETGYQPTINCKRKEANPRQAYRMVKKDKRKTQTS
jgi:hypothetical protein